MLKDTGLKLRLKMMNLLLKGVMLGSDSNLKRRKDI
jgi:hypothetical protein